VSCEPAAAAIALLAIRFGSAGRVTGLDGLALLAPPPGGVLKKKSEKQEDTQKLTAINICRVGRQRGPRPLGLGIAQRPSATCHTCRVVWSSFYSYSTMHDLGGYITYTRRAVSPLSSCQIENLPSGPTAVCRQQACALVPWYQTTRQHTSTGARSHLGRHKAVLGALLRDAKNRFPNLGLISAAWGCYEAQLSSFRRPLNADHIFRSETAPKPSDGWGVGKRRPAFVREQAH
jgi:hypothetical protein